MPGGRVLSPGSRLRPWLCGKAGRPCPTEGARGADEGAWLWLEGHRAEERGLREGPWEKHPHREARGRSGPWVQAWLAAGRR